MNTRHIFSIRTAIGALLFPLFAFISAPPAYAEHTHGDGDGGSGATAGSPFAVPLKSLDGMTLAQYVQNHQGGDPRTASLL